MNSELASRSRGKKTRIWCAATAAMSTTSALVGQARAYVLRSPHSHATIVSIDVRRARQSPGVLHILTGNDPAVLALGLQKPRLPRKRRDGSPQFVHAAAAAGARPRALHRPAGGDGDRRDA